MIIKIVNNGRVGKKDLKDIENRLIGLGILIVLAPIIYAIAKTITENLYRDYHDMISNYQLWSLFKPGFAFIGPFIGGALAIGCGIISKIFIPKKEIKFKERPYTGEKEL